MCIENRLLSSGELGTNLKQIKKGPCVPTLPRSSFIGSSRNILLKKLFSTKRLGESICPSSLYISIGDEKYAGLPYSRAFTFFDGIDL